MQTHAHTCSLSFSLSLYLSLARARTHSCMQTHRCIYTHIPTERKEGMNTASRAFLQAGSDRTKPIPSSNPAATPQQNQAPHPPALKPQPPKGGPSAPAGEAAKRGGRSLSQGPLLQEGIGAHVCADLTVVLLFGKCKLYFCS